MVGESVVDFCDLSVIPGRQNWKLFMKANARCLAGTGRPEEYSVVFLRFANQTSPGFILLNIYEPEGALRDRWHGQTAVVLLITRKESIEFDTHFCSSQGCPANPRQAT
ncbi:MAG: hypothetical protein M1830_007768 [Pleopsidium flavum]|nr:MAG: hypothetical protein M1830_007768 [Pleopsidium flavum]